MHVHVHLYNYVTVLYLVVRTYIYVFCQTYSTVHNPYTWIFRINRITHMRSEWAMNVYIYTQFGACVHSLSPLTQCMPFIFSLCMQFM